MNNFMITSCIYLTLKLFCYMNTSIKCNV